MVVLRLIGDRWSYMDRIAVAVKPMEPFKGRLAEIQKVLELESFVGYALYRTEGNHPHVIRPTTPIDLASNLAKEKLGVGAQVVVYVKQADLEQQGNDVTFHTGLLHYRQENGIKAVAKDGSDVKAYIEDLSTRLNIADSKDIIEHEEQKRGRIEGEAHRTYWVLTSEFREIQALKDAEAEARALVAAAYTEGLSVLYTLHALGPRLQQGEAAGRQAIAKDHAEGLAAMAESERSVRPKAPERAPTPPPAPVVAAAPVPQQIIVAGGGGMSKEDMDNLMTSMAALIKTTQDQSSEMLVHMQREFNTVVEALAGDMRRSASEVQELRAAVRGTSNDEKAAILAIEREVTARLEKERQRLVEAKVRFEEDRSVEILRLMGPRNEESAAVAKKLLSEQNESLRALIEEEDAMVQQQCVAMRSLAQGYELGLYSEALNSVAVEQSIQGMRIAQTTLAIELERVSEHLRRVEEQRAQQAMADKAAEEQRLAKKLRRLEVAQANRTTTVVTNGYCAVASSRGVFTYEDCVESGGPSSSPSSSSSSADSSGASQLLPEVVEMLVLFVTANATPDELYYMVTSRDASLGIQTPSLADLYDYERQCYDCTRLAKAFLSALIVECGGSPFEIADALVWCFGVQSHPYRGVFVGKLEESHMYHYLELRGDAAAGDDTDDTEGEGEDDEGRSDPSLRFPKAPRLSASVRRKSRQQQQQTKQQQAAPMDYIPFIDLMLSLYTGREVELLLSLCPEHYHANGNSSKSQWQSAASSSSSAYGGGEGGAPLEHYYHTAVPDISQWERPVEMGPSSPPHHSAYHHHTTTSAIAIH